MVANLAVMFYFCSDMPAARQRSYAHRMRRAPSSAERALWKLLRKQRLDGAKFRRQVPLGSYIVDFACFRHRLVVEADGPFHDPERDAARDAWLRKQGFRVFRFDNHLIDARPELVLKQLGEAMDAAAVDDPLEYVPLVQY